MIVIALVRAADDQQTTLTKARSKVLNAHPQHRLLEVATIKDVRRPDRVESTTQ